MNEEYSFMVDKDGNFYRVEFVPVVRCKDCKFGSTTGDCNIPLNGHIQCSIHGDGYEIHDSNWFCADGERKEGR